LSVKPIYSHFLRDYVLSLVEEFSSLGYKVVQDDAIISRKEKFTVEDVRRVAKEKMGMTAKKRKDMLNGTDIELQQFRYLWNVAEVTPPIVEPKNAQQKKPDHTDVNERILEVSQKIVETNEISLQDARSYARKAVAAMPNELNIDILVGYAIELLKADSKSQ